MGTRLQKTDKQREWVERVVQGRNFIQAGDESSRWVESYVFSRSSAGWELQIRSPPVTCTLTSCG